jgi:hypothetical protein
MKFAVSNGLQGVCALPAPHVEFTLKSGNAQHQEDATCIFLRSLATKSETALHLRVEESRGSTGMIRLSADMLSPTLPSIRFTSDAPTIFYHFLGARHLKRLPSGEAIGWPNVRHIHLFGFDFSTKSHLDVGYDLCLTLDNRKKHDECPLPETIVDDTSCKVTPNLRRQFSRRVSARE